MIMKLFILFILFNFYLVSIGFSNSGYSQTTSDYEISFASFAPLNTDLFVADADGSNPRPVLAHPNSDYNASFSRDGKWLVFTSERNGSADLYRVHADGSGLERLTNDLAFDDQGALSPDGKTLAFVSSRSGQADIWVLNIRTKKLQNLTNHLAGDFRPAWSPDGQWLAFSSDRNSQKPKGFGGFETTHSAEIYVMRMDGTNLRRITQTQTFAGSPKWSPDGKQLSFYETEIKEVNNITSARRLRGMTQIMVVDLQSGERRALTMGAGEKWSPHWLAPDRVAYVSGGPEGGIDFTNGTVAGRRGEFSSPSWSADGRQMVFHRDVDHAWPPFQKWFSRDPQFQLLRSGIFMSASPTGERLLCNDKTAGALHNSILVMKSDGTQRSVLFTDPVKSTLGPVWSPQGDRIAFGFGKFFQTVSGPAIADIAIIRSDGTGLQLLTKGDGNYGFPSWSPDGRNIVYRAADKGRKGLFILNSETGETKPLTNNSNDNFPSWSPAGEVITFTSNRDGDYEIYSIKSDGTGLKRLTNSPGNDAHCIWSPDGKWIAFSSARGGFKDESALHPYNPQPYGELYVIRADGTDARQLTDNTYEEATPNWIPRR